MITASFNSLKGHVPSILWPWVWVQLACLILRVQVAARLSGMDFMFIPSIDASGRVRIEFCAPILPAPFAPPPPTRAFMAALTGESASHAPSAMMAEIAAWARSTRLLLPARISGSIMPHAALPPPDT